MDNAKAQTYMMIGAGILGGLKKKHPLWDKRAELFFDNRAKSIKSFAEKYELPIPTQGKVLRKWVEASLISAGVIAYLQYEKRTGPGPDIKVRVTPTYPTYSEEARKKLMERLEEIRKQRAN